MRVTEFATDYDPADDAALSMADADRLLKFGTLKALKKLTSVQREGIMMLKNRQQLASR